jgi:endonuclease/exonuclease/phosphatase family metal-dependent hydrolase
VGLADIDAIAESCLSGNATYAYGGHNGLALLSNQALEQTEMLELDSWLNKRVLLYAKVGKLHVGCTHLTSRLSVTEYGGDLGSYKDEQSAQIDQVLDFMSSRAGDEPRLLLGDFNTGPELGGISAELPGNWAQLEGAGWSDPNVNQADPFCTWCASNSLTGGSSDELIDHVLVRGAEATEPRRIFDQDQAIETSDGTLDLPLSDHYGVQATVHY